jgi:hypothetical protein
MSLKRYLILMCLSVSLLALTGCGKDKTTYEDATGTTPAAFAFTNVTGVQLAATVQSNWITVSGITNPAPISIIRGSYEIGTMGAGGITISTDFTTSTLTVENGQMVRVQHIASTSNSTDTTTTLTIGGVSANFTSTTTSGVAVALSGLAQYNATCSAASCHGPANSNNPIPTAQRTLAGIKAAGMSSGLSDTQLQKVADYLATLP